MKQFRNRHSRPNADGHQRHSVERTDPLRTELTDADDRVDVGEWSHLVPPVSARIPEVRIGRRWVSTLWLLPIGAAALIVGVAVAQHLREIPTVEHFIETYPGVGAFQPPVDSGFPDGFAYCISSICCSWPSSFGPDCKSSPNTLASKLTRARHPGGNGSVCEAPFRPTGWCRVRPRRRGRLETTP